MGKMARVTEIIFPCPKEKSYENALLTPLFKHLHKKTIPSSVNRPAAPMNPNLSFAPPKLSKRPDMVNAVCVSQK